MLHNGNSLKRTGSFDNNENNTNDIGSKTNCELT